jgi:hypothetical protein
MKMAHTKKSKRGGSDRLREMIIYLWITYMPHMCVWNLHDYLHTFGIKMKFMSSELKIFSFCPDGKFQSLGDRESIEASVCLTRAGAGGGKSLSREGKQKANLSFLKQKIFLTGFIFISLLLHLHALTSHSYNHVCRSIYGAQKFQPKKYSQFTQLLHFTTCLCSLENFLSPFCVFLLSCALRRNLLHFQYHNFYGSCTQVCCLLNVGAIVKWFVNSSAVLPSPTAALLCHCCCCRCSSESACECEEATSTAKSHTRHSVNNSPLIFMKCS